MAVYFSSHTKHVTTLWKGGGGMENFIDAFAKLRKATISFVMSVRTDQLGSHWTDFHEI